MKTFYYVQLLIPVAAFIICFISQILFCRFAKKKLFKSIVIGAFLGLIVWLVLEISTLFLGITIRDFIFYTTLNAIIYLSLAYCYFHFLNLGETARRIRLVRELSESDAGLTLHELLERYSADDIVNKRVKRLLDKRQIAQRNGRYFINNKSMLIISKLIFLMSFIILGKKLNLNK